MMQSLLNLLIWKSLLAGVHNAKARAWGWVAVLTTLLLEGCVSHARAL
jgi:hypothetical protein